MKNTALTDKHIKLGAKMVPFAGYNMPVQYSGVIEEHHNVRNHVGVFDVSHMGEFFVSGPQALDLIQHVFSNDASKMYPGRAMYGYLPNENGGVVDDLIIYMLDENNYMLVVNASNIEKDFEWITKQNRFNAKVENRSDSYSLLAVQGPKAEQVLQKLTDADLSQVKFYHFVMGTFAGRNDVILSATGYTGAGGFEVYIKNEDAEEIWDKIFEAGQEENIKPIGLAARDTLRLEMGYCLYGNEIDDTTSPLEAGLGWVTKFTKDFINSDNLKQEKEQGVKNKLIGFELLEKGIPRKDYEIADASGNVVGRVTSGTMAPTAEKAIGMGYVPIEMSSPDTEINILIRNKPIKAKITKIPFI
jgi:aminomethyltransferase